MYIFKRQVFDSLLIFVQERVRGEAQNPLRNRYIIILQTPSNRDLMPSKQDVLKLFKLDLDVIVLLFSSLKHKYVDFTYCMIKV